MESIITEYQPNTKESYMNTRQIDFFRERLQRWRQQLKQDIHINSQRLHSTPQEGGDLVDQSVADSHKILDLISRERLQQTLAQIDRALQRIEEGSYGYCLASGEEIGIQRLLAYPIATLSVEAQELHEQRQRCGH